MVILITQYNVKYLMYKVIDSNIVSVEVPRELISSHIHVTSRAAAKSKKRFHGLFIEVNNSCCRFISTTGNILLCTKYEFDDGDSFGNSEFSLYISHDSLKKALRKYSSKSLSIFISGSRDICACGELSLDILTEDFPKNWRTIVPEIYTEHEAAHYDIELLQVLATAAEELTGSNKVAVLQNGRLAARVPISLCAFAVIMPIQGYGIEPFNREIESIMGKEM